ncbi:TPA: glycosyltransferase [Vibrio parahaemolyticus]|uniref:glycosyltransferase n=1 Tax=Vibrio parahaemolyticus TaxID=670 RepID=UPI00111F21EC|nr:glycosyltransferase [Vibrio parahaemolyticus]EJE4688654.1 glycosyltransferase [Vibrio parahaemolyticus]EJK2423440.1 glycosyltransferase [Vibrio parahaemolyticus]MCS0058272.1 glycosyltransferase [Vibrio parahaemolyticus]MDF4611793.1 glycosyltransferase [Vibrio parahaemolyticus]MDF4639136.1 glycosyltransferase [Vibrio parahaemolyticus]
MVIINLIPVAAGGGLQNALSFLTELSMTDVSFKFTVFVRKGSELELFCIERNLPYRSFNCAFLFRIWYEIFGNYSFARKNDVVVIFTLFGTAPLFRGHSIAISGFARSNIIERQVDFWAFLPFWKKWIKNIKDELIRKLVSTSDVIILETNRLIELARSNEVFNDTPLRLVNMAPSSLILKRLKEIPGAKRFDSRCEVGVANFIYLSGAHPNKNIHRLGPFFKEIIELGLKVNMTVTLPEGAYFDKIMEEFSRLGINSVLNNIGPIKPDDVPKVLLESDVVINVAELESFSNNWVEAWASRRLLVCKDAGYARDSCGNAAIYIDLDNVQASAVEVYKVMIDADRYKSYIDAGKLKLKELPSTKEKFREYVKIIEEFI